MPDETVLVVNSGSSSLKYELRDATSGLRLGRGIVSRIGHDGTSLRYQVTGSEPIERPLPGASYAEAIAAMFGRFDEAGARLDGLVGAGHRVVHGGTEFSRRSWSTTTSWPASSALCRSRPCTTPSTSSASG